MSQPLSYKQSQNLWWLSTFLISIIGSAIQLLNWRTNLIDLYAFRQTQTAYTIREYMAGNWSFETPLPTLGPPWNNPYEFPLFQGVAAVFGNTFGVSSDTAGRGTGLLFFLISGVLLAVLVRRWFGNKASIASLALFQFTPFALQWGASSLIEFAATAFILAAIVTMDTFSRNRSWPLLLLATVYLSLGFSIKITTAFAWSLVFMVAATGLAWNRRPSWKTLCIGVAPLALALSLGMAWTRYADSIKDLNPIGTYLTSSSLQQWNFGTLLQRTNMDQWDRVFERLPSMGASLFIFIAFSIIALWRFKLDIRVIALLSVSLIAPLTFFNLFVVHSYYPAAIFPAYVAIIGIGISVISGFVANHIYSVVVPTVLTAALLVLAWTSGEGRNLATIISTEREFPSISLAISENVPPDEGVIVLGCDWDPTPLYYAQRRGMTIPPWYYDGVPVEWVGSELTYLAFCGEEYSVSDGDPGTVLPAGSQFTAVAPGIYRIVGPVNPDLLQ
jgi:hypothetical protein